MPETIIEERVIAEIRARRERGVAKYGVGMERNDLTRRQWLQHAKEEALDLAIYLEKLIAEDEAGEAALQRFKSATKQSNGT